MLVFSSPRLVAAAEGDSGEEPAPAEEPAEVESEAEAESEADAADESLDAEDPSSGDSFDDFDGFEESGTTSASVANPSAPSPLQARLGARALSRTFRYTDRAVDPGPLQDYNLPVGAMPMLAAAWYPMAHFRSDLLADLGVTFGYERGLSSGVGYTDPSGQGHVFGQAHQLVWGGIRGRHAISNYLLGVDVKLGSHSLKLTQRKSTIDPSTILPGVNYGFVELSVDGEVRAGKIFMGLQAGILLPFAYGAVKSDQWYPETSGIGTHYTAQVGYDLTKMFDIVMGVEGRVYGLDFNPLPATADPAYAAGGATDSYISAFLALQATWPSDGAGGASGGAETQSEASSQEGDGFDSFD